MDNKKKASDKLIVYFLTLSLEKHSIHCNESSLDLRTRSARTSAPACSTRCRSSGRVARRWSLDKATALPARDKTQRVSPTSGIGSRAGVRRERESTGNR